VTKPGTVGSARFWLLYRTGAKLDGILQTNNRRHRTWGRFAKGLQQFGVGWLPLLNH